MNIEQYRAKLEEAKASIVELATLKPDDPGSQVAALFVGLALDIFGEVFLDIKRVADAVERLDADLNK